MAGAWSVSAGIPSGDAGSHNTVTLPEPSPVPGTVSSGDAVSAGAPCSTLYAETAQDPEQIQALTEAVEQQTLYMQTGLFALVLLLGLTAGIVAACGFWTGGHR